GRDRVWRRFRHRKSGILVVEYSVEHSPSLAHVSWCGSGYARQGCTGGVSSACLDCLSRMAVLLGGAAGICLGHQRETVSPPWPLCPLRDGVLGRAIRDSHGRVWRGAPVSGTVFLSR